VERLIRGANQQRGKKCGDLNSMIWNSKWAKVGKCKRQNERCVVRAFMRFSVCSWCTIIISAVRNWKCQFGWYRNGIIEIGTISELFRNCEITRNFRYFATFFIIHFGITNNYAQPQRCLKVPKFVNLMLNIVKPSWRTSIINKSQRKAMILVIGILITSELWIISVRNYRFKKFRNLCHYRNSAQH